MDGDRQPLMQPPPPAYAPPPNYYSDYPPPSTPPPPYGYQALSHQQTSHTVVVAQPAPVVYQRHYNFGNHFFVMSIIFSFICFFCGTWLALPCSVSAIFFAMKAQKAESRGDQVEMVKNHFKAFLLNMGAIITYVTTWIIVLVNIIVNLMMNETS